MKSLFTFFLSTFFILIASSQWEYVGSPNGISHFPGEQAVIQFNPLMNTATVLYKEAMINEGAFIRMKEYENEDWRFVGDSLIHSAVLVSDHMDFEFSPINGNIPIVYYNSNTTNAAVVELNGLTWEMAYPGLSTYGIQYNNGYAFDLSPTGQPTLCFPNFLCPSGPNGPGQFTAIQHNNVEWEVLAFPCVTENSTIEPYMEYNPVTGKLLAYHRGGPDQGSFDFSRTLMEFNVSSWDSLCSPSFEGYFTNGKMKINPVNGDVYFYDLDQDSETFENEFNIFKWDGSSITQLPSGSQTNVIYQDFQLEFHPQTGEPHLVYLDGDVFPAEYIVKRYNGSEWVPSDLIGLGEMQMGFVFDAEFNPVNGDLYLACQVGGDGLLKVIKGSPVVNNIHPASTQNISLFPNPSTRFIEVSGVQIQHLQLTDLMGRVMLRGSSNPFDISSVANGGYLLQVLGTDGSVFTKRVIKR